MGKWSKGGKEKSVEQREMGYSGSYRVQEEQARRQKQSKKKPHGQGKVKGYAQTSSARRAKKTRESLDY